MRYIGMIPFRVCTLSPDRSGLIQPLGQVSIVLPTAQYRLCFSSFLCPFLFSKPVLYFHTFQNKPIATASLKMYIYSYRRNVCSFFCLDHYIDQCKKKNPSCSEGCTQRIFLLLSCGD
jgi:hypothetical protein